MKTKKRATLFGPVSHMANRADMQQGTFEPRVRFNWGFHGGILDMMDGRQRDISTHFDPVYAAGYRSGVADYRTNGLQAECSCTSDIAWDIYIQETADQAG